MPKVTYNNKQAVFWPSLKKDIDDYFTKNRISKTGNWRLFGKTILLLSLAVIIYYTLLFIPINGYIGIILSALLGIDLAFIGFNIMHDANHGCYSTNNKVNEILGYTLNLLGGNSFLWKQQHNILHHTYTNVDGMDDDIAKSPFIRMCRTQKWTTAHKFQHIYLPFLYAVSTIFWVLYQDYKKYFTKRINNSKLPPMSTKDHIVFWVSKACYFVIYIITPIIMVGWADWLVGYLIMNIVMGLFITLVFQLAHVVEETEFNYVASDNVLKIENEWAVHQIKTTANFSPKSALVTYFVGGLNYQIEHHLFPRISHVHYPKLSAIVKQKCKEFNLPYICNPTFFGALHSHFKLIKELGQRA